MKAERPATDVDLYTIAVTPKLFRTAPDTTKGGDSIESLNAAQTANNGKWGD